MTMPLFQVDGLTTVFDTPDGEVTAVDAVSFTIEQGRTLGLVGESGCGKSVTALSIMGLTPKPPGRIVQGQVILEGRDLLTLPESEMRRVRGDLISMIFQEPMTSLNPVFTIGNQIGEVYQWHRNMNKREALEAAIDMLGQVGIPSPERRAGEYPHQLSGGMRQRVMIAMALACRPKLMIADEPTTALDVTIQAQILTLMNRLQKEIGAAILLITHDLGVVAETADDVNVMYAGRIVESCPVDDIFQRPAHPYTQGLLNSLPPNPAEPLKDELMSMPGMAPSLLNLKSGCKFRDRCPDVFAPCDKSEPPLFRLGPDRLARCFKYGEQK